MRYLLLLATLVAVARADEAVTTRVLYSGLAQGHDGWRGTMVEVVRTKAHWDAVLDVLDPPRAPTRAPDQTPDQAPEQTPDQPRRASALRKAEIDWEKEQVVVVRRVEDTFAAGWSIDDAVRTKDALVLPCKRVDQPGEDEVAHHLWAGAMPKSRLPVRLSVMGKRDADDASTRKVAAREAGLAAKASGEQAIAHWRAALEHDAGNPAYWAGYTKALGDAPLAAVAAAHAQRLKARRTR